MKLDLKPGLYFGKHRSEYDAVERMNISLLIHGLRSMAHLKEAIDHPTFESTTAMQVGTATHVAVYEPNTFDSRVVAALDIDRRSNANKQAHAEHSAKHAGKLILKQDEIDTCLRIRDAVHRHKLASEICSAPGFGEVTAIWEYEVQMSPEKTVRVPCKSLIDRFCNWRGYGLISDLKTTEDASESAFSKSIFNYHYHIKAAFYEAALQSISPIAGGRRFFWIAVEKEAPYAVAVYEADTDTIKEGKLAFERLLHQYAHALVSNEWPSYPAGINPISLPKWAFKKENA